MEKYHPEGSKALAAQVHEHRRIFLDKYMVDLANGVYDQVTFDQVASDKEKAAEGDDKEILPDDGISPTDTAFDEAPKTTMTHSIETGDDMAVDQTVENGTSSAAVVADEWANDLSSYLGPSLVIKSIPDTAKRADLLAVKLSSQNKPFALILNVMV